MLTPVDIQNKVFKGGIGFDKRDVESFMREVSMDYEQLYRSNVELQDKVTTLNESLQHYRATEDSMQKALTLSEKTAEETINAANDKARQITNIAEKKAEEILADAKEELTTTKNEIFRLQRLHAVFKEQYTKILQGQLKLIESKVEDIDLGEGFEYSGYFFGEERLGGGLGSLGEGGGYTGAGAMESRFERTNQDPTIQRTSLNMDPFSDAANGGGRFSRQTGKGFTANSNKASKTNDDNKTKLNMKSDNSSHSRVKKDFTNNSNTTSATTTKTKTDSYEKEKKESVNVDSFVSPTPEAKVEEVKTPKKDVVVEQNVPSKENESASVNIPEEKKYNTVNQAEVTKEETKEETMVSGEVESKVSDSSLIGNDDDDDIGFSFMEEDVWVSDHSDSKDEKENNNVMSGDVEDKINESTLLSNDDDDSVGFEFMGETYSTENDSSFDIHDNVDESIVTGEVEDRNIESTMLDSEDNYGEDFDFVVGNEEEEEDIPIINSNFDSVKINVEFDNSSESFKSDDSVLVGDVEETVRKSNRIGNDDDLSEGFDFL